MFVLKTPYPRSAVVGLRGEDIGRGVRRLELATHTRDQSKATTITAASWRVGSSRWQLLMTPRWLFQLPVTGTAGAAAVATAVAAVAAVALRLLLCTAVVSV